MCFRIVQTEQLTSTGFHAQNFTEQLSIMTSFRQRFELPPSKVNNLRDSTWLKQSIVRKPTKPTWNYVICFKSGRQLIFYIQRFNVCKVSFRLSKLDRTSSSRVAIKLIISFLVCVQKKSTIVITTAIAAGMDQQTMTRKQTCIFCRLMWIAPRLDVPSVRRPDMFRLLPFTETVFAALLQMPFLRPSIASIVHGMHLARDTSKRC